MAVTVLVGAIWLAAPTHATGQPSQQAPPDYVIGVNDVLSIVVFNQANMSGKFQVGADGTFAFLYLDRVKAAGMTARAVETDIRDRLGKNVLKNPQVSVTVEGFRSQQIFVFGPVAKPAPYEFSGSMTVLQAILLAGGETDRAGTEALLVRGRDGKAPDQKAIADGKIEGAVETINLLALRKGDLSQNLQLFSGDTLIVQDPKKVHIEGHVARPGVLDFRPGLVVRTAISQAGGIVQPGSERRLQVIRKVNGKEVTLDVKMNDPVEPEDIIKVRPGFF